MRDAAIKTQKNLAVELGITPAAHAKLKVAPAPKKDPFEAFLKATTRRTTIRLQVSGPSRHASRARAVSARSSLRGRPNANAPRKVFALSRSQTLG